MKSKKVMKKLKNIAKPPMRGITLLCTFRSFGLSVAPNLKASFPTKGVKKMDNKKATNKAPINIRNDIKNHLNSTKNLIPVTIYKKTYI